MATHYLTTRQYEAYEWGRSNYGSGLKKRLSSRPEQLPKGYRHLWAYPFGVPEWNEHMRILRRLYYQGKICNGGKVRQLST